MSTVAIDEKMLKQSYRFFLFFVASLIFGLPVIFIIPLWAWNLAFVAFGLFGILRQIPILRRYPRLVLPWFMMTIYLAVAAGLGYEFLRDGFIHSGR